MEPLLMETEYEKPLVLVVDDDPTNLRILVSKLNREYRLGVAKSGTKALEYMGKQIPDLVLLDVMMPDMDGYAVCEHIKRDPRLCDIPVVFISYVDDPSQKTRGFEVGGVDYITKPFEIEELLARIRTTLRRLSYAQTGGVASEGSFDTGELHIDFDAGIATMDGEELHLTPIEYKLLCLLAHNADKVLTHQFILHEIWGTATKSDLASLRVFMGTLRKKIESDPAHPRYIQTHVGIGYRLVTQG